MADHLAIVELGIKGPQRIDHQPAGAGAVDGVLDAREQGAEAEIARHLRLVLVRCKVNERPVAAAFPLIDGPPKGAKIVPNGIRGLLEGDEYPGLIELADTLDQELGTKDAFAAAGGARQEGGPPFAEAYHGWIYSSQTCPMGCSEPKPKCPACCQDGEWVPKTEHGQCALDKFPNNDRVCKVDQQGNYSWQPKVTDPPCSIPKFAAWLAEPAEGVSFQDNCAQHDICYGGCISPKSICDKDLYNQNLVDCWKETPKGSWERFKCREAANAVDIGLNSVISEGVFNDARECCQAEAPGCAKK